MSDPISGGSKGITPGVDRCGCGVSSLQVKEGESGGTNSTCHGFTGGVSAAGTTLFQRAQVTPILWDHFYVTNPEAKTQAQKLMSDLVTGSFVNGLAQYGVHPGTVNAPVVLDTSKVPGPKTWDVGDGKDQTQITNWINDGTLPKPPKAGNPTLLYFIFMPSTTKLTAGKNPDNTPNTNVCGWHHSGNLSDGTPIFWALVRTDGAPRDSAFDFINGFAFCVGHELVESLTDPSASGFIASNGCEIGDLCEPPVKAFFSYRGWNVEWYWSNWDAACIHGDSPVSIRRFAKAIGYDAAKGLRGLPGLSQHGNILNIDYIADKMFPQ